jgi:hypothetical protein
MMINFCRLQVATVNRILFMISFMMPYLKSSMIYRFFMIRYRYTYSYHINRMCGYEVFVYIIYIILPEKAEISENPFDCSNFKLKSAFFPPLAI